MNKNSSRVTVVGAGLTGPLMSIFLAKRGYNVDLFEAREDSRKTNLYAGRSINLALSERGINALRELKIFNVIEPYIIPMKGRMIHKLDGGLMLQPYSVNPNEFLYSVSRGELNQKLLDEADKFSNIRTTFNRRCTSYDFKTKTLHFSDPVAQKDMTVQSEVLVAADGSYSAVRKSMEFLDRFNYSQEFISYGYKELTIPAGKNGSYQIEKNALHIWPRKNFMLIALPNLDGSFTCTLFLSFDGEDGLNDLKTPEKIRTFFQKYFPDTMELIPDLAETFLKNPTGSLITVKCSPWNIKGEAVLIGDAAHAITPFFGQGMNASFEDCVILNDCLDQAKDDFEIAFTNFSKNRKKDADAIANMALENFIEMRDLVADPKFQLKRGIEQMLEKNFPEQYKSRYALVTFSRTPYSEVYQRGVENQKILEKLSEGISEVSQLDLKLAEKLLSI